MLDSPAVRDIDSGQGPSPLRVGFVTQLLWERYGPFWVDLVRGAGATAVFAAREQVAAALNQLAEKPIPGTAFRLAAAQALALADCDIVLLPRLNPESTSERGSSQDRWVGDLPGAITDVVAALGETHAVAAYPDPELETPAVLLLQRLLSDAASVPRVWSRHRRAAERQGAGEGTGRSGRSGATKRALAGGAVTAVVAQPWLLTRNLEERILADDAPVVTQLALEPDRCRDEGWRSDDRLIATDAEVLGAARILSRRSGVARLRFLVDEGTSSSDWLARRLSQASHKVVEPWGLEAAIGRDELFDAMLYLPVD